VENASIERVAAKRWEILPEVAFLTAAQEKMLRYFLGYFELNTSTFG
jgi:hypothetical protein